MAPPSTIAQLRAIPLFAGLEERDLARLVSGSIVQLLPRGAVLFEEGTPATAVHVLLSGRVALTATGGSQQQAVIETFGAGEVIVAPAAILGLPYLVSGQVTQDARILFLQAEVFRRELDDQPALARALVDMLARHWRVLIELMTELKVRDARERLARWLIRRAADQPDGTVALAEPKSVLARRLGMTPESLSRALAAFEAAGSISVARHAITVRDAGALGRLGDGNDGA
jgi:CRP/FNR family transcriptional activator FtrB